MFTNAETEQRFNKYIASQIGSYNNTVSIKVKRSIFTKVDFVNLLRNCTTSVKELPYLTYKFIELIYSPVANFQTDKNWQQTYLSKYNYLIIAIVQIILAFDATLASTLYIHEVSTISF